MRNLDIVPKKSTLKSNDDIKRKQSLSEISVSNFNAFQRQSSLLFYISYSILFVVILVCTASFLYYLYIVNEHEDYQLDISLSFATFFGCGNAMLVFRLFGIQFLTEVLHCFMHAIIFGILVMSTFFHYHHRSVGEILDFYEVFLFPSYVVLAIYILQCVLSIPLAAFLPGSINLNLHKGKQHHACGGLLTFCVITWNYILHISMICTSTHETNITNTNEYSDAMNGAMRVPSIIVISSVIFAFFIFFIMLNQSFDYEIRRRIRDKMLGRKKVSLGPRLSM